MKNLTPVFLRISETQKSVLSYFKVCERTFSVKIELHHLLSKNLFIKFLGIKSYQQIFTEKVCGQVNKYFYKFSSNLTLHFKSISYLCGWVQSDRGVVESLQNDNQQYMIIANQMVEVRPYGILTFCSFLSLYKGVQFIV